MEERISIALTEQEWERIYFLLYDASAQVARDTGVYPWETTEEMLANYIVERLPEEADHEHN